MTYKFNKVNKFKLLIGVKVKNKPNPFYNKRNNN